MERLRDELATIDLGDKRLNARAVLLAERMAAAPTKSIPSACHGWAETQAGRTYVERGATRASRKGVIR